MCRMIFAVGKFDMNWLIDDIIQMASDNNEKHEENTNVEFKHPDGWGLTYLDGNNLKTFRSTKPIYDDPQIEQFRKINTRLIVLHARHGTTGDAEINNIHPFENKNGENNFLFFHNGTIWDELEFDSKFQTNGSTDSEKYFYYLLSGKLAEIDLNLIQKKIINLKDFSGANFVLTDGKMSFLADWFSLNPLYYTMKMLQQGNSIIISSEILPHYRQENWTCLENHCLLSIRTEDLFVEKKVIMSK
ncbi:class II glutamine amidotransferase [candidate division KSB1 bacterium]|nr:class II glutamine amidotransferase [candidate division KSB1 bacterium]MBL7095567.1 class II glutamine amidotransferase [candidate division KSB1 bacterium]